MGRSGLPRSRALVVVMLVLMLGSAAWPALADQPETDETKTPPPVEVDPSIQAVWDQTDGQIVRGEVQRPWIFGPEAISAGIESYPQSPTGYRKVVYYDKGRLDLNDPTKEPGSTWLVQGALLVNEMLSGRIQLGENEFVKRELPEIPLVGDVGQEDPVTYADLAPYSTIYQAWLAKEKQEKEQAAQQEQAAQTTQAETVAEPATDSTPEATPTPEPTAAQPTATPLALMPAPGDQGPLAARHLSMTEQEAMARLGEPVDDLLTAEGEVVDAGADSQGVTLASYNEINHLFVASPFDDWAQTLPMPALNLIGLPVTQPYWVEAEVGGESVMVLVQAFERRMLTYTPSNPEGWKVESANVGIHYRLWRGLERPENPELAQMAAVVPFGEEVLAAARENYIDPYIFAAVAMHVGKNEAFGEWVNGGVGILGARPVPALELDEMQMEQLGLEQGEELNLADPGVNVRVSARQFADFMYAAWDWPTILASYYSNGNPNADTSGQAAWVDSVMTTYNELLEKYPPSGPRVDPIREKGRFIGEGHVAYYSPSYTPDWWARTMGLHAGWGNAVEGWQPDPNGFYCVHPDYLIGEVMKVEANGRVIECTIGDMVAVPHQISWRAHWVLEMNWNAFKALGLDRNNQARVSYLGDREILPTPTPPTTVTPSPSPSETKPPVPVEQPVDQPPPASPTPVPPTATPQPSPTAPPPSATPSPSAPASPTASPTGTASPSPTVSPTGTASPTTTSTTQASPSPTVSPTATD